MIFDPISENINTKIDTRNPVTKNPAKGKLIVNVKIGALRNGNKYITHEPTIQPKSVQEALFIDNAKFFLLHSRKVVIIFANVPKK